MKAQNHFLDFGIKINKAFHNKIKRKKGDTFMGRGNNYFAGRRLAGGGNFPEENRGKQRRSNANKMDAVYDIDELKIERREVHDKIAQSVAKYCQEMSNSGVSEVNDIYEDIDKCLNGIPAETQHFILKRALAYLVANM